MKPGKPLQRKVPLKRGNKPLKRTRIRRQSKEFRRRQREAKPVREQLVREKWLCECCLKFQATQAHEIANGPCRQEALDQRCVLLAVCTYCNCYELTDKGKWPVGWQLGMLRESRPDDYDLDRANEILLFGVDESEVDSLPKDWWTLVGSPN